MAGKVMAEIRQSRPPGSVEEEVYLNIARTFEVVQQKVTDFLRPYELSPTQYNVLRILRGAGREGVTCSQAAERMLNHDPDMTRLLDRLERRGLVARERSTQDRRVVMTRITDKGMKLLGSIDQPIERFQKQTLRKVGAARLRVLIDLLEQVREAMG
jgi:DNA-binding MarR family transcriptional regulator